MKATIVLAALVATTPTMAAPKTKAPAPLELRSVYPITKTTVGCHSLDLAIRMRAAMYGGLPPAQYERVLMDVVRTHECEAIGDGETGQIVQIASANDYYCITNVFSNWSPALCNWIHGSNLRR